MLALFEIVTGGTPTITSQQAAILQQAQFGGGHKVVVTAAGTQLLQNTTQAGTITATKLAGNFVYLFLLNLYKFHTRFN